MTVAEAIDRVKWAKFLVNHQTFAPETEEALDMAVRSLEAWQNVIKVLTDWKMECAIHRECDAMDAYWHCAELIEHTMKKVVPEDERTGDGD